VAEDLSQAISGLPPALVVFDREAFFDHQLTLMIDRLG